MIKTIRKMIKLHARIVIDFKNEKKIDINCPDERCDFIQALHCSFITQNID